MSIVPNFVYFSKALSYSAHQKNLDKYIAKISIKLLFYGLLWQSLKLFLIFVF